MAAHSGELDRNVDIEALCDLEKENITIAYAGLLSKAYASDRRPERVGAELEKRLPQLIEKELTFMKELDKAFASWSQEENPVVLFDIDETIGSTFNKDGTDTWYFRPSFFVTLGFLREKYPSVKVGILSSDTIDSIRNKFESVGKGSLFDEIFSINSCYSIRETAANASVGQAKIKLKAVLGFESDISQGEAAKIEFLDGLRVNGVNVKNVDDGQSALYLGDSGLCVKSLDPRL